MIIDVFGWMGVMALIAGMVIGAAVMVVVAVNAAYRNGVTDGYGYLREPGNPGYRKAGRYLLKHMSHRWPELDCDCPGECEDCSGGKR